ncbi:MAG: DUF4350 domain-containing protein [Flavobacteriales bacterium]|nr:DUF4350 domain-containing protein [Flavobacteriales bacterium]
MLKNPNIKYYVMLALGFVLVVLVQYNVPKPVNWMESYSQQDKVPYGCFILKDLMPDLFPNQTIIESKLPAYNQLKDQKNTNYIIINNTFKADKLDAEKLLKFVSNGNNVFIAANHFEGKFAEILSIKTKFGYDYLDNDTITTINLTNKHLNYKKGYSYNAHQFPNCYFTSIDSNYTTVLGEDKKGNINFIKVTYGEGNIYINTLPKAFTNYYLTDSVNYDYAFRALSYLPNQTIIWDEYYKAGRRMVSSPIRYILGEPALKMAYLVLIFSLLVYIIFNVKRKQRIIPVIEPLKNVTVGFVDVVGTLYYQNKNHYNLAEKKITYFLDFVRTNYLLKTNKLNADFIWSLTKKSGVTELEVNKLIGCIASIKKGMSEQELIKLNKLITEFHQQRIR